jgi:hypothetical protein
VSPLEVRMAHLEGAYEQTSQRLAAIDLRFDGVDRRFDAIDRRFDAFDRRFNALDRKIDERFLWTIGVVLSTWLTTMLAILFRHS